MFITRVSINNPVFAAMMMIGLCILGLYSYQRMNVENLPDVSFPIVVVQTAYPGSTAISVEKDVTKIIEQEVSTISGVKSVTSKSYAGNSQIIVEFTLDIPVQIAVQDVRDKVALVKPFLNDSVEDPLVAYFNPDDIPIYSIAFFTDDNTSLSDLSSWINETVAKGIRRVEGVGKVSVVGAEAPTLNILPNMHALDRANISIEDLVEAIKNQLVSKSVGNLQQGATELPLYVGGTVRTVDAVNQLVVGRNHNVMVRLADVAEVNKGIYDQNSLAFVNGRPAMSLDIIKSADGNTIEVVKGIEKYLASEPLPKGVEMKVVSNYAEEVKNSFDDVQRTIFEGALLAVIIVFLFLQSWRSTVITGLTLPISIIGTFFFMYFLGFTLNVMTMMALSLSIGILIDDAIVVRENIVRHIHLGKSHFQAAFDATQEIGIAVLATTLCIVAVFMPVAFMDGIIGEFFYEFGVTVCIAVLISMFVSFVLDPMLSSHWKDPSLHQPPNAFFKKLNYQASKLVDIYKNILLLALSHRKKVLGLASATFIASLFLLPFVGAEFTPATDNSKMLVSIKAASGSSLQYTEAKAKQVEAILTSYAEVDYTYISINSGAAMGKNAANIIVRLVPKNKRDRSQKLLEQVFRERLSSVAGVEISVGESKELDGGKPVKLNIYGNDLFEMATIAERYKQQLSNVKGLVDISVSSDFSADLRSINVDKKRAFDLGVNEKSLADTLQYLYADHVIDRWEDAEGQGYDVKVMLSKADREDNNLLRDLHLPAKKEGKEWLVPMNTVVNFSDRKSISQVNRRNLQREITLSANVYDRAMGDVFADIQAIVKADKTLPNGYSVKLGGAADDMAETATNALIGILLGMVFIYLILGSLFNSFILPLTIMASLPLSLIGVFFGLFIAGSTLNIFSVIGFIMLMGLVTKNAILLVDFINDELKRGTALNDAILASGVTRLQPIIMTTLAMIFGMLPLALGLGEGSEQRAPMAHAIIGGLITSTLLTLVIVPVLYSLIYERKERKLARKSL